MRIVLERPAVVDPDVDADLAVTVCPHLKLVHEMTKGLFAIPCFGVGCGSDSHLLRSDGFPDPDVI